MADAIIFNTIRVNGLETNAGVFVGVTSASGWESNNKSQGGITSIIGFYNQVPRNVNIIHDNDIIDTPINQKDYRVNPVTQL